MDENKRFAPRLIDWQRQYGRHDLPWQNTGDAYRIWLSEIMLQQTQVRTATPYYQRFVERFPTIDALAAAPLETVLELWSGLGYYARARNLHRCAQIVVEQYAGRFPEDPERIAQLPGIGRSTAAAIGVFAYGRRAAILDGNVRRVLARCFAVDGFPGSASTAKTLWALAESLLPAESSAAYTQGLMDLGSMLCTRRKPFCAACPMVDLCLARQQGRQSELPVAKAKKALPERETELLLLTDGKHVLLERRPPAGIWGGLLTLPEGGVAEARVFARRHGFRLVGMCAMSAVRHSFTHFHLHIQTLMCSVETSAALVAESGWQWLALADIDRAALPAPIKRLLSEARTAYAASVS